MVSQVNQLARNLPGYQSTLGEKIQSLQGVTAGTGTLERASEVLKDLSKEIDRPNNNTSPNLLPENGTPDKPIPVEIKQPDPGALQTLVALITPLIHPLTTTGIVAVFVIFILMQRQDLGIGSFVLRAHRICSGRRPLLTMPVSGSANSS